MLSLSISVVLDEGTASDCNPNGNSSLAPFKDKSPSPIGTHNSNNVLRDCSVIYKGLQPYDYTNPKRNNGNLTRMPKRLLLIIVMENEPQKI